MEYITNGIRNICFSSENKPSNSLFINVDTEGNTYQYRGNNNEETTKLYYNLMKQVSSNKIGNEYKTTISLEGNQEKHIYFSTFKKLF